MLRPSRIGDNTIFSQTSGNLSTLPVRRVERTVQERS
jgi:hypothetical protein